MDLDVEHLGVDFWRLNLSLGFAVYHRHFFGAVGILSLV